MTESSTESLSVIDGIVIPVDRANVDTDAILPKQYMKSIRRTGFGHYLFDEWRYLDPGVLDQPVSTRRLNPTSVFNQSCYLGASILLARENFGCGSSREHAPWALRDYGIRVLIAPSFADIFRGNCFKNNLLCVELRSDEINQLFDEVLACGGTRLGVSVFDQTITTEKEQVFHFDLDPKAKRRLVEGLDDIAVTLALKERISAYEAERSLREPWLFPDISFNS